jgi:hypothetical protein
MQVAVATELDLSTSANAFRCRSFNCASMAGVTVSRESHKALTGFCLLPLFVKGSGNYDANKNQLNIIRLSIL